MKAVMDRIAERKRRLADHPFHAWVRDPEAVSPDRFDFAVLLVGFIMGFPDLNRWFMRYADPSDGLRHAINEHTYEDERHAALFVEDWRRLGLDERLGWTAGETLAWLHASPETEEVRRHGRWIQRMLVENPDPLVRFALMESIESWGHVVFAATAEAATALGARTGRDYRYFGPYHLERELGGLIDGDALFEEVELDDDRRVRALRLVDGLFDVAEAETDLLAEAVHSGPPSPAAALRPAAPRPRTAPTAAAVPTVPAAAPAPPAPRSASATRIRRVIDDRRRVAAAHPLIAGVTDAADPVGVLRRLAVFWAPDCLGYRDLALHVLSYPSPANARERAVNRWTADLGTHHVLFLRDWVALGVDEHLGLTASETLEHYCLRSASETQRRSAAEFVTLAARHPDPARRHWLVEALQASGDPFFGATRALALRAEPELGTSLDYFADRHEVAHRPLPHDPEAAAVDLGALELGPDDERAAVEQVHAVFDRLDAQMTASWDQVRAELLVPR